MEQEQELVGERSPTRDHATHCRDGNGNQIFQVDLDTRDLIPDAVRCERCGPCPVTRCLAREQIRLCLPGAPYFGWRGLPHSSLVPLGCADWTRPELLANHHTSATF